jgi:hypothetical protein
MTSPGGRVDDGGVVAVVDGTVVADVDDGRSSPEADLEGEGAGGDRLPVTGPGGAGPGGEPA